MVMVIDWQAREFPLAEEGAAVAHRFSTRCSVDLLQGGEHLVRREHAYRIHAGVMSAAAAHVCSDATTMAVLSFCCEQLHTS